MAKIPEYSETTRCHAQIRSPWPSAEGGRQSCGRPSSALRRALGASSGLFSRTATSRGLPESGP